MQVAVAQNVPIIFLKNELDFFELVSFFLCDATQKYLTKAVADLGGRSNLENVKMRKCVK